MKPNELKAVALLIVLFAAQRGESQTSELYMLYSPNVIYPVGTTYVYREWSLVRSWTHASQYECSLVSVGGTIRQGAVFSGFSGTEYTAAGLPTGTRYSAAPDVFDATSDGTWIYGWNVITASLMLYDLDWNYQGTLFSLGSDYAYAYMGITYDPQARSIWLAPWLHATMGRLYNYSLNGALLGTFSLASSTGLGSGLAYDGADNTLWMFNWRDDRLEQYSKSGGLLSTVSGRTRIYGLEFAVVPEPSVLALVGSAVLLWSVRRFRSKETSSQIATP